MRAAEHAAPDSPLRGLPPFGGDRAGRGNPLVGGLGTAMCLRRPPSMQRPGWPCSREVLEGGEGVVRGSEGEGGGSAGPPSSYGPPVVPSEGGPKIFEASILLAPKVPKQTFGCQPQTLQEEEGGGEGVQGEGGRGGVRGGTTPPPTVYGRSNTSPPCSDPSKCDFNFFFRVPNPEKPKMGCHERHGNYHALA